MHKDTYLCCPQCGRAGEMVFEPGAERVEQVRCGACGKSLAVYDGVPDFAAHVPLADSGQRLAQRIMNTRIFASTYESFFWRPLHTRIGSGLSMEEEVHEVLTMADMGQQGAAADLACGTGHYARALARKWPGAPVYGLDISPGMLVQGRKIARREGLSQILFLRGDIYRLPFSSASLERVHCGGALHLFGNLIPIWAEVSRVLKPGGVFTAMTLTQAQGLVGRLQQALVERGKATFFDPGKLSRDLQAVGLSSFKHRQHRVTLLFCAMKNG